MMLYGELKKFNTKALITGDIGIELTIYAICNEEYPVDTNALKELLHKPLKVDINESRYETP